MKKVAKRTPKQLFLEAGAFAEPHFVFSPKPDGTMPHARVFVDAAMLPPDAVSSLAHGAYEGLRRAGIPFEVVVGPERGGRVVAEQIAYFTRAQGMRRCIAIFAQKDGNGGFIFHPSDARMLRELRPRVVVADDVLTKGTALMKVAALVRETGALVVAGAAFLDRSGELTAEALGLPHLEVLWQERFETWTEEECALTGPCAEGIPIRTDLGHGSVFLARKQISQT